MPGVERIPGPGAPIRTRYGEFGGAYRMETWSVATTGYKAFDGVRVGNAGEATWKLKGGDWTWLTLEIAELEFNRPEVF